jgi:hypothetical protein
LLALLAMLTATGATGLALMSIEQQHPANRPLATTHGFRSSFRDWVGDCTSYPREVAEAALAHQVGNEVEAAYRGMAALEKRRELMEAWAGHCEPKPANVVTMSRRRRR